MPLKFVVCDLLITKDNTVYITELCPALSCLRFQDAELFYATILGRLAPQGFKMVQAPQEPKPEPASIELERFLSHYERDSDRPPFSTHSRGRIPKTELRNYLSKVFLQHADAKAALWIMYFRDGVTNDISDKFALVLRKLFARLKVDIYMVDAYPLGFACERDKVLFGQLLKLENSQLWIPKEIFRFSTFDERQRSKLTEFLRKTPDEKFIIKPTNASLTHGVFVVSREKVIEIIMLIVGNLKQLPQVPKEASMDPLFRSLTLPLIQALLTPLVENITRLVYPDFSSAKPIIQEIVQCDINKFIGYWFSTDTHTVLSSDRDFFLVEAFKPPKLEADEINKCDTAVASRGYFAILDINSTPPLPMSVISKRCYKVEKLSPDARYMAEVSFCDNYYTYNFAKKNPNVVRDCMADYAVRSKRYREKTTHAFQKDSERAWMKMLATLSVSDFIARVQTANPDNRELLEYLASQSVQDLNLESMEFCWHCYALSAVASLQRCGACLQARYCNADCQRADWTVHKTECKSLKMRLAVPATESTLR